MRFLGVGEYCDLGDMYYRLGQRGNEVRVYIECPEARDIFSGMIETTDDWRTELPWIREAGREGILVFESASKGAIQDQLRREGYQVIGGCEFGDKLEGDREFGQSALRDVGLQTAASYTFSDFSSAIEFVQSAPARYVYKCNGANALRTRNYIGEMESGADLVALLSLHQRQWKESFPPDFVLMAHVTGVEVGVGAYFNGKSFLLPACLDWEHKRMFPGDLGELTGEMGTIVTYRGAERIFELTLAKVAPALAEHGYCGYINLSLIANEEGLWPLEFTSRFGYPGFAICEALHSEPWEEIFHKMLDPGFAQIETRPGFAAGVVLTVPPFPYGHGYEALSKGMPIMLRETRADNDTDSIHWAEVMRAGEQLVTSGMIGYVGVATGVGSSIRNATDAAYQLATQVVVPNLRYRNDIGEKLLNGDWARLVALGYIEA